MTYSMEEISLKAESLLNKYLTEETETLSSGKLKKIRRRLRYILDESNNCLLYTSPSPRDS